MKTKYIITCILLGFSTFWFSACEDKIDPLITDLEVGRVFAPTGLEARVRNLTQIELTWNLRDDAAHYIVEFSEDDPGFTNIIRTITVMPHEIPLLETFAGETEYSIRVKGVSANTSVADSRWATTVIMTAQENIFLPIEDGDIDATEATLRWVANSEVTHLLINPGSVTRIITAGEVTAGVATITGLTGDTDYTVALMRDTKSRGTVNFSTLIDVGDAVRVYPEDDLNAVITDAAPGEVLVLFPGDYTVFTGLIVLNKSITIRGLYPFDKPKLHVQFSLEGGASAIEFRDIDMSGNGTLNDLFRYNTANVTFGSLVIDGCYVHDFTRSFVAGNASATTVQSVVVNNTIVTNVETSGGDFIDFRNTYLADLKLTNSTFNNSSTARDFIRMDGVAPASGLSGTGLTSTVLVDHCTIYRACNNATVSTRRLLYVRFNANVLTVRNSIIAESGGFYSNQATTSQHTSSNNNYFNAPRFHDASFEVIANLKVDVSGNFTTLDPGFVNAAAGNFKVSNQTLLDNSVGDPRWLQ
ncbi:MAG: fibronectin type III domain-containing protein [Cyclobacteriaceae bacterium]|nr:fibronectin type III domain-containing protein [Cyclobacteriaceae bacterium]